MVDFRPTAAEVEHIVNKVNFTINFTTHFCPTAAGIEQIVKLIPNIKKKYIYIYINIFVFFVLYLQSTLRIALALQREGQNES